MALTQRAKFAYLGPLHLPTGFGQASREHLKALVRAGVPICGRDTSYNLPIFLQKEYVTQDHEINELTDDREINQGPYEGYIYHTTPDQLKHLGKPSGGYIVWEVEGLPKGWAEGANQMDFLFTPSHFSKRLFVEGGVTKPIYVSPHPMDFVLFNPDVKPMMPATQAKPETVFLVVSQWMPRKGVEDVITAYLSEFTADESVGLLMFVWGGSHSMMEQEKTRLRIRQIREGMNLDNQPRIWFIGDNLPSGAIPEVYSFADVVVSASRGEAFGLPLFEAAACGKPSISTGYGGQWDLLTEDSSYSVEYDMEPCTGVGGAWRHYNAHQQWARVKLNSLRQQMRRAHEDKTERIKKGQRALELVLDNLSHEKVGLQMKKDFYNHVQE